MTMIRLYFRQAWNLLCQNPLFSVLYIIGTALALTMTTTIAVIYYVRLAPVYPERNRSNTMYLTALRAQTESVMMTNGLSYQALQDWAFSVDNAEVVTAILQDDMASGGYIHPTDGTGDFHPETKLVDHMFFRVYSFQFLAGAPFTQADLESGIRCAVISDDLARRLFGNVQKAVGSSFTFDFQSYRVTGVVRAGSRLTPTSYAQVYLPYSVCGTYRQPFDPRCPQVGAFTVIYVAREGQKDALRQEVQDLVRRFNQAHSDGFTLNIGNQPVDHLAHTLSPYDIEGQGVRRAGRYLLLILVVLLIVPAINLSGMIASRMESRLSEMGVRKSFGATRRLLLRQVIWENLLLTGLGALIGLLLSWLTIYVGRQWVFDLFDDYPSLPPADAVTTVSGEMLFAPSVFLLALLLCVVFNLMAAIFPAWNALRRPIVYSLYERR